jgi:hypothetical protein
MIMEFLELFALCGFISFAFVLSAIVSSMFGADHG